MRSEAVAGQNPTKANLGFGWVMMVLVVSILFSSCAGRKGTTVKKRGDDIQQLEYTYFSTKAKIKYQDSTQSLDVNATIRIRKDSLVWISAKVGPMEVVRVQATTDSVYVLNKHEKVYQTFSIEELGERLNVDLTLAQLEAVLVGNNPLEEESSKRLKKKGNQLRLKEQRKGLLMMLLVNPQTMKITEIEAEERGGSKGGLQVKYSDFVEVGNGDMPSQANVVFSKKDQKTLVDIKYRRPKVEKEPLNFSFHVPDKYVKKH